ncbi:hypothetical protein D3C72_2045050 [compost metagenome]
MVGALDLRSLLANLAHAVEEQGLCLIVLGFFRALEQSVIDLGKDARQLFRQPVHHQLATALHQLAKAWLDATAGEGWRWFLRAWRYVLVAHGLS